MDDRRITALEEEVRRLDRENRRRGRMLLALGVGCGALLLMAARTGPSVVRAERFELTDRSGEIRGVLTTVRGSPMLELSDEAGGLLVLEVAGGQASIVADGSHVDGGGADEGPTEEAPEPEEVIVEASTLGAGVRMSFAESQVRGVMVDCPKSGFRYLAQVEDGVAWVPEAPEGEECRAFVRGTGFPARATVRSGDDVDCRLSEHLMLICEPTR